MPVGDDDPCEDGDDQEDESEGEDAVGEGEGVAARGGDGASNEPEHIYEDGDDHEEGERGVHDLFGVMPKRPQQEQRQGRGEEESDDQGPDQILDQGGGRQSLVLSKPGELEIGSGGLP